MFDFIITALFLIVMAVIIWSGGIIVLMPLSVVVLVLVLISRVYMAHQTKENDK